MKKLIATLLASSALACAAPAFADPAYVASSYAGTDNSTSLAAISVNAPVNYAVGDTIFVACSTRSGDDVNTPTDANTDTFHSTGVEFNSNGSANFDLYYTDPITTQLNSGQAVNCNYSATDTNHKYIRILAATGLAATGSLDARVTNTGATGSPSVTTGTLNYGSGSKNFLLGVITANGFPTDTPSGTWVSLGFLTSSIGLEYNIVASPATTNAMSPTDSPSTLGWDAMIADFTAASGGGGGSNAPKITTLMMGGG